MLRRLAVAPVREEGGRMTWHTTRYGALFVALALWLGLSPTLALAAPAATQAKIYLVALGDNGASGERIGCGDSLIPVTVEIPTGDTLEARITLAVTKLLSLRSRDYGESGLITVLADSRLTVDRVTVENGVAAVYLSGTLSLGGTCDDPRALGQIAATARQFQTVTRVEIVYNGGPLTNAIGELTFPQVPYAVAPPFYPYWERQGGLPIFGFPLSKQIVEGGYRAQYFERQRLESHPENAAPYAILLGLVGNEAAARRGLLTTAPFAPTANNAAPGCEYVDATRHTMCGDFRTYWHRYGLDFGEPGITARESLALFGFPISEPFEERLEDGTTYRVQYFERARFEYHPENPAPYTVLLGRLTADLVPAEGR
jgi:hypothetical protein